MRSSFRLASLFTLASTLPLGACDQQAPSAAPTDPSRAILVEAAARETGGAAAPSSNASARPQERAVLAAMESYKQAVLASDVPELVRIWTDDYTLINPQGAIVTKAQRIANFSSGNTDVSVIDSEREITVRVYGDMAIVQNLSTLRGQFNGVPTATDLRGTFVWVRREGRWQLATNQLTPVAKGAP